MGNVSRNMETLRKTLKEILGIKNTITEIKNACMQFEYVLSKIYKILLNVNIFKLKKKRKFLMVS